MTLWLLLWLTGWVVNREPVTYPPVNHVFKSTPTAASSTAWFWAM